MSTIIDDSAVRQTLIDLERGLSSTEHRRAVNRAARKGANILKNYLRNMLPDDGPFEHINIIKRAIRVTPSKAWRKYPGANVLIKGPDVPVGQGASRRFWELADYAYLVLYGNYKTKDRPTKSGDKKGNVKGLNKGNIFQVVKDQYGDQAIELFMTELVKEVEKELAKAVKIKKVA